MTDAMRNWIYLLPLLLVALDVPAASDVPARPATTTSVFATVDGAVISRAEFTLALRAEMKRKFYHGKVPAERLASFQREVGEQLIERALLFAEAKRRGIEPDQERVAAVMADYDARNAANPRWAEHRNRVLGNLRDQLKVRSVIEKLARQIREVHAPAEQDLVGFYAANPGKFTEPERLKLSMILLKVPPSANSQAWSAAHEEAVGLLQRLKAKTDFAELARLHSSDPSANQGGDMGYVHRGMLGSVAQEALDGVDVGELTEPVALLEGIAIFRVDERPQPRLNEFRKVRDRAEGLWLREERDAAWQRLIAHLRLAADIQINEAHFLPLPTTGSVVNM